MARASSGSEKARFTLTFLRSKISNGEWPEGSLIPKETELMEMMGVGKSTVREAVRSLATLGMLEPVPGVGTFVRALSPVNTLFVEFLADHDTEEVLIYRRSLEIEAAQRAAVHRSPEQLAALKASVDAGRDPHSPEQCNHITRSESFHRLIVEASGSKLLLELYTGVMASLWQAAQSGIVFVGITVETMHHDHSAVLNAIARRNVRAAGEAMALHVDRDLGFHVVDEAPTGLPGAWSQYSQSSAGER